MEASLFFVAGYFVVMALIGFIYSSRQKSIAEFITASKGLGYWIASFSARATGESGWLLLGLTGMGFAVGLGALWVVLGEVLGVAVSWLVIAPAFKKEVDRVGALTILDFFEEKLGDRKHLLRIVFSVILLVMVTAYVSAQITATGKAFNGIYGWDVIVGEVIGTAVVLLYVTTGGFRAVAVSDFIQGLLMLLGLILVPLFAVIKAGGVTPIIEKVSQVKPELLSLFPDGFSLPALLTIIGFIAPGLGFLGSPQIYQRFIAIKSVEEIKKGTWVAITYTLITDTAAVLAGLFGRFFFETLKDQEAVYPKLVDLLFPSALTGFFLAVILAAIMSTMDSLLILAATTAVRDVYQKVFKPDLSDEKGVFYLRILCVVMTVLGLLFAMMKLRLVFWFVLFAWAGIASAFCPPLIMTLFWRGTTKEGVLTGALTGFLTAVIWKLTLSQYLYEMVPGFVASFLAVYTVSKLTGKKYVVG